MELRHLRYFVAAAEELHVTRAAARFRVAQPALSQQLKQLEAELGAALFHRLGRRIQLTDAGRILLEKARRILAEVEEAAAATRRAGSGEVGSIAVGFSTSVALDLLSQAVAIHREKYPSVRIELRELNTAAQLQALIKGDLHVGLIREKGLHPSLEAELLRREPLVAVLPTAHKRAAQRTVALRELAEEPFLLAPPEYSTSYYDLIMRAAAQAGFTPRVAANPTETLTILTLVAAGTGVALLPASVQRVHARGVAYRRLRAPAPTIELLAAWQKGRTSPLVSAFVSTCRQAVRQRSPASSARSAHK